MTSAPRRAASSASAKPMRPEERLPTKRTASIGSRVPPAVDEHAAAPSRPGDRRRRRERGLDRGEQRGRLGQPPDPPLPRRAERARARLQDDRAAARAAWPGWPASRGARTSRRSSPARRAAGAGRRAPRRRAGCRPGRRRAWRACWPTRARPGRRRRSRRAARCESGACAGAVVAREGAAQGVGLPLGDEDRGAGDGGEGRRADEARRGLGLDHPDGVAGLGGQARELERLVGRDPARDAEQEPAPAGGPAAG